MASSSSSPSRSNNRWNYSVFLSFRGADTRCTFTGHLHRALDSKGINVFIDNELKRGEVITSQLLKVIEESEISIIVLSQKYASSSFCLDELVKILECRESKGQTVIPVFYHVDPTDVEEQTGTFGQEFAQLKADLLSKPNVDDYLNYWKFVPAKAVSFFTYVLVWMRFALPVIDRLVKRRNAGDTAQTDRVQNWRSALTKVATLSGLHLKDGDDEATSVQSIVKLVLERLDRTPLHVAEHPVALASSVSDILEMLTMKSDDVCMLGLYGMAGIGKTTTALALYNRCFTGFDFDGSCFLLNVREKSKSHGLSKLQEYLLFEILGDQKQLIENFEKGVELIKDRLGGKKVFIVIDDVDCTTQLEKLAGSLEWFGAGSKIIITTSDLHLLHVRGVTRVYKIKRLENNAAMELFSWYAFKQPQPPETYMENSTHAVRYAEGHPLALKVLGSSLYGREVPEWEDVLKELKKCPSNDMTKIFKVSYEGLEAGEKAIFLDIAFYFEGMKRDVVTKFLKACGLGAFIGIKRLIEKSLIYEFYGALRMHGLLESMGTQIALEESSRLCIQKREEFLCTFHKDKNPYGVEMLLLDFHGEEEIPLKMLENLTKLRLLVICNGRFSKMPKSLPNSLRWLEWRNYSLNSIPLGFLPANHVVLKMPCSSIKKPLVDIYKTQKFVNLTHMSFSSCNYLMEILGFSAIPNLEELDLSGCGNLKMIDKSIGSLQKLKNLNLKECLSLTSLPNLAENRHLESIDVRGCSRLESLPDLPTTLINLGMSDSGIKEIPMFIGNLPSLHYIYASNCKNLVSVCINWAPLYEFNLTNCPKLNKFPEVQNSMVSSRCASTGTHRIRFSGNDFVSLPINTFKFTQIRWLELYNCKRLIEIPKLPRTLYWLGAQNCKSLMRFSQFQFGEFTGDFTNCHKLVENEMQSWKVILHDLSFATMEVNPWRQYSIILPGNEIPEWFNHIFECEGNVPSFKLPSSVLNDNLIGIALCVVFQYPQPYGLYYYGINFSMNDHFPVKFYPFWLSSSLESEHMWLCFYSGFDLPKLLQAEEVSCKFKCHEYPIGKTDNATVYKRFGVHFIYKN